MSPPLATPGLAELSASLQSSRTHRPRRPLSDEAVVACIPWVTVVLLLAVRGLDALELGYLLQKFSEVEFGLGLPNALGLGNVMLFAFLLSLGASAIAVEAMCFFLLCELAENRWSVTAPKVVLRFWQLDASLLGIIVTFLLLDPQDRFAS